MLGAPWIVFLAVWLILPGIRELSVGASLLLGFTIAPGFAWWCVWFSVFLLTVAEKVMTKSESEALFFQPSWTADGARILVLDPLEERPGCRRRPSPRTRRQDELALAPGPREEELEKALLTGSPASGPSSNRGRA
jgi:hypothetical protein